MTRIDSIFFAACILVGVSFTTYLWQKDFGLPPHEKFLGSGVTVYEALISGLAFGLALAGPVLLLTKTVRIARFEVSLPELLWAAPVALHFLCMLASSIARRYQLPDWCFAAIGVVWGLGLLVMGLAAGIILIATPPMALKDRVGLASCVFFVVAIATNLVLHPPPS